MNTRTAGPGVRLISVTIATGEGRADNLIGSSLRAYRLALRRKTELGRAVMKCPLLTRLLRRWIENVVMVFAGAFSPRFWNASVMNRPPNASIGVMTNGSSTSSARLILLRLAHLFLGPTTKRTDR